MTDPRKSLAIENVVGSTGIEQELDLANLAEDLEEARYDPERFPGLVYPLHDPKAVFLVFRSGNIVCTGARSIGDVENSVARVFERFREIGLQAPTEPAVTIQNMVMSGDLNEQLNLSAVAIGFGLEHVEYEPEQFPGLVYRLPEHEVVALLFGSGKVVITGGTKPVEGERAIAAIQAELAAMGLIQLST